MNFFNELKRRNVFKVAAAYVIVGWLIMQVGDTLGPALLLPGWINSALAFFLILGFPLALFFAWAFEMTPDGIKKEKDVDRGDSIAHVTSQKLNGMLIGLLVLALAYFAFDKFVLDPERDAELVSETQVAAREVIAQAEQKQDELLAQPSDKSIAVLPFQNRSANEENAAFFSDGMHDELLTKLSKISALKVISRTSVLGYRDTTKNLRQVGEELGVANILEGGVQRAGDTVRINVQLINASTDEHLWAETYDRELSAENIFAIQSEISHAIARALEAKLSPREHDLLTTAATDNLQAYDHWLLANQLLNRANWQGMREAQAYLNQAIELDPQFVQAHVSLARSYSELLETGAVTLQEINEPWRNTIQKSLSLDSENAEAHAVHAMYLWRNKLEGTEQAFNKARQLEPANVEIMDMYGMYLRKTFQLDKALSVFREARALDPVSLQILYGLARVLELRGETDQALEIYSRVRQLAPASQMGYGPVAGLYMRAGDMVQAVNWLVKARAIDPNDSDLTNWVARLYMDFGDLDRARQWTNFAEQNQNINPMTQTGLAMLDVYDGQIATALERTTQSLAEQTVARWGSDAMAIRILLIGAIHEGQFEGPLDLIRQRYPEFFGAPLRINAGNVLQAIDTAHLLQRLGQHELASTLLQASIATYDVPYAESEIWTLTGKAQALALLGEKEAALTELRRQVDGGWRLLWRWDTELNPNFESLNQDPEFLVILEQLRADMASQLAEVRKLEASGEIPLPPGADS